MKRSAAKVQRAHDSSKKPSHCERTESSEKTVSNSSEHDGMPVKKMKNLYCKSVQWDLEFQKDFYKVQCDFDKAYKELFDKRHKLLLEHRDKGDNLSKFWLLVLKTFYGEFITERDEEILAHLHDIRYSCSPLDDDLMYSYTIHFHFAKNRFFANKELKCTFHVNMAGEEGSCDELLYDGADVVSYEGCNIEWTPQNERNNEECKRNYEYSSFFDIFILPELPNRSQTRMFAYVKACLCHHFELGYYLKQRVIPKAILFFTGEISDLQPISEKDSADEPDEATEKNDSSTYALNQE